MKPIPQQAKVLVLAAAGLGLGILPAHAQYFSNHDGYTDSGQYRWQLEFSPYLWLPATSGSVGFAHQEVQNHIKGNFSTSVPSIGELASSLHFSFMGDSVLRYGPYSGEIDLQYVDGFGSKTFSVAPDGNPNRLHLNASYIRIAPGIGYQVYRGDIFSVPISVDARAGFAYFEQWTNLQGEGNLSGEIGRSGNFVQPWVGTRVNFVPTPRWRIEIGGLAQGFGINDGSWGWGASAMLSYAFTDWFAADIGYSALNSERNGGNGNTPGAPKRNLHLTAYGPVIGVSLRFGSSPPPPPAPPPAAIAAAPAPAPARTFLVFFDWDKYNLTPRATQIVAEAADASKTSAMTTLTVNGYTDTSGAFNYNMALSERRAKSVATQLVADGVPVSDIEIQAYGETHLLVPTGPGVREPQNRRVEIVMN